MGERKPLLLQRESGKQKETYHQYRFALSLENMCNIDGYITEKILDCFCAGIVPIYHGARNIDQYIPKDCYIPYSDFSSLPELEGYLMGMTEDRYNQYLDAASEFLRSEKATAFSVEKLATVLDSAGRKLKESRFRAYPLWAYRFCLLTRKVRKKQKP